MIRRPIETVVIIIAMEAEAAPLVQSLGLIKDNPSKLAGPAPSVTYTGKVDNLTVHVVWNGKSHEFGVDCVGTVPAALAAYLSIMAFNPDIVISAGTAGGFMAQGAKIGDVFVSSCKMNHDRRIPIPGFDAYGIGRSESIPTPNLQAALQLKLGVVTSGNSLDYTDKCMSIMLENSAALKEMEAAAIAWVCNLFEKPMFCVKAVTDIVDGDRPAQDEFLENLHAAATALQDSLPKILEFIAGKLPQDL